MADNVVLNAGVGGDTVAADDIAGVKYTRSKMSIGAPGAASDVSSVNPLPVTNPVSEASLGSIDTKTLVPGQALMAASSPVVLASNHSTIPVVIITPTVLGAYGATFAVLGSAAAQNLLSIQNPGPNTVKLKRSAVVSSSDGGTVTAAAGITFRLGRTTGVPTGTLVTSQKRKTADPVATAIVRSTPVATLVAGPFWSGAGAAGNPTGSAVMEAVRETEEFELASGESAMVDVTANDVDCFHSVTFYWQEV